MSSWPPRGIASWPQANPPSMRRSYMLATPNATGGLTVTGPFPAVRVPDAVGVSIERGGQLVTVTDRIQMPLASQARTRCIVTDVSANVSYEILEARVFATFIDCAVSRTQGDQ